jgi:anti-sigma factor RsiW
LVCRDVVELVTDYLEGALDVRTRARFDAHIAGCDHCSAYLVQMRMTLVVVGHLEPEDMDPHVERRLLEVFRDWKGRE